MNKVVYGFEQVHIAFLDSASTTPPAWSTPVAIPGAVGFKPKAEGEATTFYADNGPYFSMTPNNGYTGDLEMALLLDTVLKDMLGWEVDTNGMLVEVANSQPKAFALMGQVIGDVKNRRFVYYNCLASRPTQELSTSDDKGATPATETLSLIILPITVDGQNIVKGVIELNETNQTAYNSFFTAVTLPATEGE
jgi:phi13 family phage major tail protein